MTTEHETTPSAERRTLSGIINRAIAMQTLMVLIVVGLATTAVLLERSIASMERKNEKTLLNLSNFEFQVLNAETGFRGFALAHKEPFLAPYREAFPAIAALQQELLGSIDAPDRPYMHEALRVITDWRRNFAEPSLRHFQDGRDAAARAVIASGEGKRRIDRIRALVNRIRLHEEADLAAARHRRQRLTAGLVVFLLLGLALGVVGGRRAAWVLRRAVVDPMGRLVGATQLIRSGDLSARAEVRGAREVALVAESFNEMAGEVESTVASLREVDELKTRFLSTVSHELRTPLTSISGYLQLLEQGVVGELTPEQLGYVHVAQRNGERLASLIDDLLMLSRFDAGRIDLKSEPVDLAEQLRNLREEMQPVADKGESRLELETAGDLVVEGDARRLQQSFANLVSNAIKFNRPGGEVKISAAARNGAAVVEVTDEGVGIPPGELTRIGERFFRASTTTNVPGTGLGLAITREIVERHGGTLEIESEVGSGSTFRISLPRTPSGHLSAP
jgi:signal transduction histidine kinase